MLLAFAGSYCVARSMEQGIADTLGLVTLRHGTDLITWFKIHAFGARPEYDQSQFCNFQNKPIVQFTVATTSDQYGVDWNPILNALDNEFKLSERKIAAKNVLTRKLPPAVIGTLVRVYKFVRFNRMATIIKEKAQKDIPYLNFALSIGPIPFIMKKALMHLIPVLQKIKASYHRFEKTRLKFTWITLSSVMTPSIKFRFHPSQVEDRFTEFDNIPGRFMLLSEENISPFNMGLIGSIKNSMRCGVPAICRAPLQVIQGAITVLATGAVAGGAIALFPGFIEAHKVAIIAGAILAII